MKFENYAFTHPGHIREVNEDSFYVDNDKQLWLVCDGMGGHDDGNFASRLVTDIFEEFELSDNFENNILLIEKQINIINNILIQKVKESAIPLTIGTTLVLLYIYKQKAVCIHVGDSRCYVVHEGEIISITKDHSVEIEENNIKRKVLTSAISSQNKLNIETNIFDIDLDDKFILCSDGFYDNIDLKKIELELKNNNIGTSSKELIKEVLKTKADDNITLVQVRLKDES